MSAIAFDTHSYVKKLRAAGLSEEQAEIQAQAIAELVNERLVTKDDLDLRLAELKSELVKWILGVAAGQIAILISLLKLFP